MFEYDYLESKKRKCPVCGKEFYLPPENVYKLRLDGKHRVDFCSYTCFRVEQKKLFEKIEQKRRERDEQQDEEPYF